MRLSDLLLGVQRGTPIDLGYGVATDRIDKSFIVLQVRWWAIGVGIYGWASKQVTRE